MWFGRNRDAERGLKTWYFQPCSNFWNQADNIILIVEASDSSCPYWVRIWQLQMYTREKAERGFIPPTHIKRSGHSFKGRKMDFQLKTEPVVMETKSNNVNITVSYIISSHRKNIIGSSWEHIAFPQR